MIKLMARTRGKPSVFDNCTGHCDPSPHVCDCDFMPGRAIFLTESQRLQIYQDYHMLPRGRPDRPWSAWPYEPWVIETWKLHSQETGGPEIAARVRHNLTHPQRPLKK